MTAGKIRAHSKHMTRMTARQAMYRWLFGRIDPKRFAPFRINTFVKDQTFVRVGPKKIVSLDEAKVVSVAHQFEAVLVMAETLEGEHPVALAVTNLELAHFVAYVRQLDETYRRQHDKITRLEKNQRKNGTTLHAEFGE